MSVARRLLLVLSFASEEGWVAHLWLPPLQSHKARDAPVATAVRHHVKPSALSRLTGGTIAGGREAARADPSVLAMALCMREWKVQGGGAGRLGRSASSCGGGGGRHGPGGTFGAALPACSRQYPWGERRGRGETAVAAGQSVAARELALRAGSQHWGQQGSMARG